MTSQSLTKPCSLWKSLAKVRLQRPVKSADRLAAKLSGRGYVPAGSFTFMETNDLGFVASLLFVLVPTVFLIILFIQTNSREG